MGEAQTPVLIKDVATVRYSKAIRYGALTKDGNGEAVGGIVMLLKNGNSNDVIKRVCVHIKVNNPSTNYKTSQLCSPFCGSLIILPKYSINYLEWHKL